MFRILLILFVSACGDELPYRKLDISNLKAEESDSETKSSDDIMPLFQKFSQQNMFILMNWLGVSDAEMDKIMYLVGMRVVVHDREEDRVCYAICAVFGKEGFRPCSVINFRNPAKIKPKTVFCNGEVFMVEYDYFQINHNRTSFALVPDNENITYPQEYVGFYRYLIPLTNYLWMPWNFSFNIYEHKTASILCLKSLNFMKVQETLATFLHLGLPFFRAKDLLNFSPQFYLVLIARFIAWAKFLFPGIDGDNLSNLFRRGFLRADRRGIKGLEDCYGIPILKRYKEDDWIISYSRLRAFQPIETSTAPGSSGTSTTRHGLWI